MSIKFYFAPYVNPICHDDPPPADPPSDPPPADPPSDELVKVQKVNAEMASQLKGYQAEISQLQQSGKITAGERSELEERLHAQVNELKTKDELSAKGLEKMERKHSKALEESAEKAAGWRNRYIADFRQRSLMEAAAGAEPYNPSQIVELLAAKAQVIETDPDTFSVQVTFPNPDKEGDPLVFSPADAVKHMADSDDHANLFVSKGAAGAFRRPASGSGGEGPSLAEVAKSGDLEAFKKLKDKQKGK